MKARRVALLAALVVLALFTAACGSKNLLSLAKLDKGDISVRDRFGNQVRVPNPEEYRKALKDAKKVADPKDQGKNTKTDYVILNDTGMISYDYDGKYLVYTDSASKRYVYQGDLGSLIVKTPGLPPHIATGKDLDSKLSPDFAHLSKTNSPWAAAFTSGGKQVVMITAGAVPSAGYTFELERAVLGQDGVLALTVKLTGPSEAAASVISYPYTEVTIDGTPELDVRMVTSAAGGDRTEHVALTMVDGAKGLIPVRPERGALVLERLRAAGFVKTPAGTASVEVAVEDGHNVLGKKTVTAAAGAWTYFEADMDIQTPTNPYGSVIYRTTLGAEQVEVIVPVSFSGK